MAAMPKINKVLEILDPIIFPKDMSEFPFMLAKTETINSGAEVPKATIVKPITKLEMPNFLAIDEEPSINISAPFIKKIKPNIKKTIVKSII